MLRLALERVRKKPIVGGVITYRVLDTASEKAHCHTRIFPYGALVLELVPANHPSDQDVAGTWTPAGETDTIPYPQRSSRSALPVGGPYMTPYFGRHANDAQMASDQSFQATYA